MWRHLQCFYTRLVTRWEFASGGHIFTLFFILNSKTDCESHIVLSFVFGLYFVTDIRTHSAKTLSFQAECAVLSITLVENWEL